MTKKSGAHVRLDTTSKTPAYRQIADQLRTLIVEGALPEGNSLPPVRRLALELGVHFNTVAQAYRTLAEEKFLDITHGHSAMVIDRNHPEYSDPRAAENFRQRLRELIASVRARGLKPDEIAVEMKLIAEALEET